MLVACDPGRDEPPPDVKDTIFDEQVKALDKARGVEDIQDEHMKKLREAVGDRFTTGVVLYDGEMTLPFGEGLKAVPLGRLWSAG